MWALIDCDLWQAPKNASISGTVVGVALIDTFVSLLAGLALFPIVFASGLNPSEGPGLMFVTLPFAFGNVAFGQLMGVVFLVLVAASSGARQFHCLSRWWLIWSNEPRFRRLWVTFWLAFSCWFVGLGTVFSFSIWKQAKPLVSEDSGFHLYQWGAASGLDFFGVVISSIPAYHVAFGRTVLCGLCRLTGVGVARYATNCRCAARCAVRLDTFDALCGATAP